MSNAARQYPQALEFLRVPELFVKLLPFRNIARHMRRSDGASALISNGRDGERDINQLAASRVPNSLEVFDAFSSPDALQDLIFLVRPAFRKQHCHRHADRFSCGIAIEALRAAVPGENRAV